MSETSKEASEKLTALGFELEIWSGPAGTVRDDWPHIAYEVKLHFLKHFTLTTPYTIGVGHVNPKKARTGSIIGNPHLNASEKSLLMTWRSNPSAQFKEKQLWADVAAKLAKNQKIVPDLAGVLHCLLMDGQAFFNASTFEDWALEYGHDVDSRKAEAIYKACDETGRKLSRVGKDVLDQAREILKDF